MSMTPAEDGEQKMTEHEKLCPCHLHKEPSDCGTCAAIRQAEIDALEWAVEEFETALDRTNWEERDVKKRIVIIRAEIERRRKDAKT